MTGWIAMFALIVATTAITAAPPADAAPFRSCDQARAAGAAPLYAGQPGYSTKLDRDGDGIACEVGGASAPLPAAAPVSRICPVAQSSDDAFAIIGCYCVINSSDAATADGSTAFCRRLQRTDAHLWSLRPDEIPHPLDVPGYENVDPQTYVCMTQTERSAAECAVYLARSNFPGDAERASP